MPSKIDRRALLSAVAATGLTFAIPVRAQEAASTPKPAAAPRPPLAAYSLPPFVDQIALSPNGKRVAVVTQNGDEKILMVFDIADVKPQNFPVGAIKVRDLFWGDNDHVVLAHSTTLAIGRFGASRHEFMQAVNIDTKAGQGRTLFTDVPEFDNIVIGNLGRIKTADGYRITASNFKTTGDYDLSLYSFPINSNIGRMINLGTQYTEGWVLRPDGFPVAYSQYGEHRFEWKLYINAGSLEKGNNFKEIYRIEAPLNTPELVGLGRDGQSVLLYVHLEDGSGEFREMTPAGVLGEPLDTGDKQGSHSPLFHPVTGCLAGFSHDGDWVSYAWTDPVMVKMIQTMPEMIEENERFLVSGYGEDPRQMLVYSEGNGNAGTYSFVDFSTGDVVPLTPNYPQLPRDWIAEKKPVSYKAADGLDIHGYLTLPPQRTTKSLPLIVLPHGGPESRDDLAFDWQAQALASLGYAVLQPNFRGSSGYGAAFVMAGHGEWGRKMQTDLSDGVRWLAGQGIVDPKRVAIFGASYGGYAALAGATLDAGVYTCAVAIAAPSDLAQFVGSVANAHEDGESRSVKYWQAFLGDASGYADISPARQAAKASCPILLIHGTDDTVVPIEQSRAMERALKSAGKTVEFVTYKGQDHWETIASTRIAMMQAAVDFLAKYNPA